MVLEINSVIHHFVLLMPPGPRHFRQCPFPTFVVLFLVLPVVPSASAITWDDRVNVGDRVQVNTGFGVRRGVVERITGSFFHVRYLDEELPQTGIVDGNSITVESSSTTPRKTRETGPLYQAIGRALAYAGALALLVFFAVRQRRRRAGTQAGDVVEAELID